MYKKEEISFEFLKDDKDFLRRFLNYNFKCALIVDEKLKLCR